MAAVQPKPAKADNVPSYFLSKWTVDRDCTEAHAGTIHGHTVPGLQIQVKKQADGSYTLVPVDGTYSGAWPRVTVEYRAGRADGRDSCRHGMRTRPGRVVAVPRCSPASR